MDPDDENALVGMDPDEVPKQEPTDEACLGKKTSGGEFKGFCRATPGRGTDHLGEGRCKHHGGLNSGENGQGGTEGNQNAVTHGAYAQHAVNSLTEAEREAFEEISEKLEDPEDAQEIARHAASYCLMMGHRAADDRWFRRYEGLCDKFGIAPEDVERREHTGEGGGPVQMDVTIRREEYDGNDE